LENAMFRITSIALVTMATLLVSAAFQPAFAFIKVDLPMGTIYRNSDDLYLAKVRSVERDKDRLIVSVTKVVRAKRRDSSDNPPTEPFAIQFDSAKELLKATAEGAPGGGVGG